MLAFVARLASCVDVFVAYSKDAIDRCVSDEKSMRYNVDVPSFVLTELFKFHCLVTFVVCIIWDI